MRQKREKYVPRHRQPTAASAAKAAPRKVLHTSVLFSGVAVAATTGAVSTGVLSSPVQLGTAAAGTTADTQGSDELQADFERVEREAALSRSQGREATSTQGNGGGKHRAAPAQEDDLSDEDPREIGRALLPEYGFSADQFGCLDALYVSESDWDVHADNPTSSAYGIPQALTEMHELPPGYMNDPEVQIRWGLGYIQDSYGTPCSAWSFKQANDWY